MGIVYRPGKQNVGADALCRREQEMPHDGTDERLQHRHMQLFRFITRNEEQVDGG